jgi:NTE family protein
MTRVGIVLGAGGVLGQAYQSGVLASLHQELGFDPRTAEVVVGTSAGSITAALIRLGVSPAGLAAWTLRAPLADDAAVVQRTVEASAVEFEPLSAAHLLRVPSAPSVDMIRRAVIRPWQFRPLAAGLALLAPGRNNIVEQLSALVELDSVPWPEQALWICAVRRRDGRRIVFGRSAAPPAPLHLAVASSCAVPGYFTPVDIGGVTYVDGGAHSPTNAAILRSLALDLVVIVSPMSGPPGPRPNLYAASRRHAARLLRREVRALHEAGIKTAVFSPSADVQRVMGDDLMSYGPVHSVVAESQRATRLALQQPELRAAMEVAATRSDPAERP